MREPVKDTDFVVRAGTFLRRGMVPALLIVFILSGCSRGYISAYSDNLHRSSWS